MLPGHWGRDSPSVLIQGSTIQLSKGCHTARTLLTRDMGWKVPRAESEVLGTHPGSACGQLWLHRVELSTCILILFLCCLVGWYCVFTFTLQTGNNFGKAKGPSQGHAGCRCWSPGSNLIPNSKSPFLPLFLARIAIIKHHRLGALNKRNLFCYNSGGWMSKIKVPAGSVSSGAFLFGVQVTTLLLSTFLCIHLVLLQGVSIPGFSVCVCVCPFSSFYKYTRLD